VPRVVRRDNDSYGLDWDRPQSFGKLHGFYGNFGVLVRAWTYMSMLGRQGIRDTAEAAVLNNAYLTALLEPYYDLPFGRGMHESVFSGTEIKKRTGVKTMDIAKRLLDYGFHAPTVYFPLNVPEALMTEPTETETKDELERYADACIAILREAENDPEIVTTAPHDTPLRRLDEGRAARQLDLRWTFEPSD
jgi:glycine dehydrogenase subunit 2